MLKNATEGRQKGNTQERMTIRRTLFIYLLLRSILFINID